MPGPGVPPASLARFGSHELKNGTVVDRFYSVTRKPNDFNPCLGEPTRFAPLRVAPANNCVPTLYVGESYEAAAFETIARNLPPRPHSRRIFEQDLKNVGHARLRLTRTLRLAPFFHQNLAMLGQTRQSMIDTDARAYVETMQWAARVHETFPEFDGLIWTSHQHDRDFACVLFGDRVRPGDLRPITSSLRRADAGRGRERILRFADEFDIDVIPI